jgi:hypothetical protein
MKLASGWGYDADLLNAPCVRECDADSMLRMRVYHVEGLERCM